ncbi:hypothetical protein MMC34_004011 [Xylographa carneopallida]|nr:hypothetical protein [Xylographa carneopallida]
MAEIADSDIRGWQHLNQEVTEVARQGPFPAELLFMIFGYLEKEDCKAIRLVSQTWSAVVTAQLFDTVYFAIREKDVDGFAKLTQHPTISKFITRLDYDITRFCPRMSIEAYIGSLLDQVQRLLDDYPEDVSFDNEDVDTRDLIQTVRQAPLNQKLEQLRKSPIVAAGFWKYTTLAKQQAVFLETESYRDTLIRGLARLPRLHSIVVSSVWKLYGSGEESFHIPRDPVLVRLPPVHPWNPFHLYPENTHRFSTVYLPQLRVLFEALTRAKSLIDEFSFSLLCDASDNIYNEPDHIVELNDDERDCLLQAFQGLNLLNLHLSAFDANFRFLLKLLGSLPFLERLFIHGYDCAYPNIILLFEVLFRTLPRYAKSGSAELKVLFRISVTSCRQTLS